MSYKFKPPIFLNFYRLLFQGDEEAPHKSEAAIIMCEVASSVYRVPGIPSTATSHSGSDSVIIA